MNIPEVLKNRKPRRMRFHEKLQEGWWWFFECFEVWSMCMTDPYDNGEDFFCHINSDYVAYVEDVYYCN